MSDSADLLFELGTEELPPVALKRLSESLTQSFVAGLAQANLSHGEVTSYATPRRLALRVSDCLLQQPDRDVEKRGPAVKAAFDKDGNPSKAAEGFARSCGTTVDALERRATDKGEWLYFQAREQGQPASKLLPGIAEEALNKLPIPKRMRWGVSEAQFVRPVHWLLFLHGNQVVPCTLLDAKADRFTYGHRFHFPGALEIGAPAQYIGRLQHEGKVIAHFGERRERIKTMVSEAAAAVGATPDLDDDLLDEVTALNEWPQPITASFEQEFLEVPAEALVATMKKNQKYFPLFDDDGKLVNKFITIANIQSTNPGVIREGNERVVRPRLADAMFFWRQDGKKRLEDHLDSLKNVVFQQKLGSMYEKSERVATLATGIASLIGGDVELTHRAGLLSRCDLMTEMVYEFPEMQGIMGRYQAARDGEPEELGTAMDEFYMPRHAGDELPRTRTGIAIALAERLDTLVGIFGIGQRPTGDKDPFGLRRAALGALRILREHALPMNLAQLLHQAAFGLGEKVTKTDTLDALRGFMLDRLKGLYADEGVSSNRFQAVASVAPLDLSDFDARIAAVTSFQALPEADALAAANKRIRNILKKSDVAGAAEIDTGLFEGDAEKTLHARIEALESEVGPLLADRSYEEALKVLAQLRDPVDAFFDQVMVNADDPAVRANRLALLDRLSALFLGVADISALQE